MNMDIFKSIWLDTLYPVLCILVPCIVYQIILVLKAYRFKKKIPIRHFVWTYIFIFYIYMVLSVTGIGSIWDIGKYDSIIRMNEINLTLFQSDRFNYVANIIMFIPLGFLLPLIWRKCKNIIITTFIGAGFSLFIEIGQLFNHRVTDIDDLIMNTLGAIIGFCIWKVFSKIFKQSKEDNGLTSKEAIAYLSLSIIGMFFLYNPRFFVNLFYFS